MERIRKGSLLFFICQFLFFTCRTMSTEKEVKYTAYAGEIINIFLKEMKQDFGFDCMGNGGSMPYDVRNITVLLASEKKVTIKEARQLGITGVKRLLKIINNHEKIKPYLYRYPFTANDVDVTISFRDHRGRRRLKDGSISSVSYLSGKVFYRIAEMKLVQDPGLICGKTGKYLRPPKEVEDETLVTILSETYEEAKAIVEKEKQANL